MGGQLGEDRLREGMGLGLGTIQSWVWAQCRAESGHDAKLGLGTVWGWVWVRAGCRGLVWAGRRAGFGKGARCRVQSWVWVWAGCRAMFG